MSYANVMLDMVKAFERVSHQWLVNQGQRYEYPMRVLRLSIAAYRLGRCIAIDGICSELMVASRGITAGAVHATIELRLLLIQWLDETVQLYRHIVITVYVDDTSFEASGSDRVVCEAVVGAVRHFTKAVVRTGGEFSPTKNIVLASRRQLAYTVYSRLSGLSLKVVDNAKSLGGAISSGRCRNAAILAKRLKDFKVRKMQFQKLRRMIGARRNATVLRTGGTAALVYGQANTGVSCSMLYRQRSAVAAASVPNGSGELDLLLIVADGSMRGKADPAFAAHEAPIGKWAEAVWESWLPRPALDKLAGSAVQALSNRTSPWAAVKGPARAFVASAWRLGWVIHSYTVVSSDLGQRVDFTRDPPAMVMRFVQQSVWRWRWRRVEARHPHLIQGLGGHGAFVQPIFKLLNDRGSEAWGAAEKGALRSAFTNRQWPQARLRQAGLTDTANCKLCVLAGLCDPLDPDPRFTGHLAHRILTCPATAHFRHSMAPQWIQELVRRHTSSEGALTLSMSQLDLLTRGIAQSLAPLLDPPPAQDSFQWVVRPDPQAVQVNAYVDGSRLDGEHDLHDLCARQGWAIAAYDKEHQLVAAAHGRTPPWAKGIHATELWGLLMAVQNFDPGCALKVDCAAVQIGSKRDAAWANAPCRTFARAWGPISNALADDHQRVVWMPAHNTATSFVGKKLSNGELVQSHDVIGKDMVDELAKRVARTDAMPRHQVAMVRQQATRLREAAMWIGRATAYANRCPLDALMRTSPNDKRQFVRDSEGMQARRTKGLKRKADMVAPTRGSGNTGMAAQVYALSVAGSPPRRRRIGLPALVTPTDTARYSAEAKRARLAQHLDEANSAAQLSRWLERRPKAKTAATVSGVERLAALKRRVVERSTQLPASSPAEQP